MSTQNPLFYIPNHVIPIYHEAISNIKPIIQFQCLKSNKSRESCRIHLSYNFNQLSVTNSIDRITNTQQADHRLANWADPFMQFIVFSGFCWIVFHSLTGYNLLTASFCDIFAKSIKTKQSSAFCCAFRFVFHVIYPGCIIDKWTFTQ